MAGPEQDVIVPVLKKLKFKVTKPKMPGDAWRAEVTDETIELLTSMQEEGRVVLVPDGGGIKLGK